MVVSLNVRIVSVEDSDETTKWEIQNTENGEKRIVLAKRGSFGDLVRGIQNSFNHFSLVRLSYLDDEEDVIAVEGDDELVEMVLNVSRNAGNDSAPPKTEKASESQGDEKASPRFQRERELKAKRLEALNKRDHDLLQRIESLGDKILALQQRRKQLEENREKVRSVMVELAEDEQQQQPSPLVKKIEKKALVPTPTPMPAPVQVSRAPVDQLGRLRNQEQKVRERLANLPEKERKDEKTIATEKMLVDRLNTILRKIDEMEKKNKEEELGVVNQGRGRGQGQGRGRGRLTTEPKRMASGKGRSSSSSSSLGKVQLEKRQQSIQKRLQSLDQSQDSKVVQNLRKRLEAIDLQLVEIQGDHIEILF